MVPRETSQFCFPSSSHRDSRENKTNCFPRDRTLSVYGRSTSALLVAIVPPTYQIKLLLLLLLLIKTSRSVVSHTVRFNLENIFAVLDHLSLNQTLGVVHLWPDRSILMRKFVVQSVDVLRRIPLKVRAISAKIYY